MPTWSRGLIGLTLVIVLGFIAYRLFPDDACSPTAPLANQIVCACAKVIPGSAELGSSLSFDKDNFKFDITAARKQPGANADVIAAFASCLRIALEAKGRSLEIVNGVNIPKSMPIGVIASQWSDDKGGFYLDVRPGTDPTAQNLRIGPAIGTKSDVMETWCRANAACVACDPPKMTTETGTVTVTLKDNPPVEKIAMEGKWAGAPVGVTPKPWELIDPATATRYYFECKAK